MNTNFSDISSITGIPCDNCMGAAFVIQAVNSDIEILKCNCPEVHDQIDL